MDDYYNLVMLVPHVLGQINLDADPANMPPVVLYNFEEWVTVVNRYYELTFFNGQNIMLTKIVRSYTDCGVNGRSDSPGW